jgi:hypothetical protein
MGKVKKETIVLMSNTPLSQQYTIITAVHHYHSSTPLSQQYTIITVIHHYHSPAVLN